MLTFVPEGPSGRSGAGWVHSEQSGEFSVLIKEWQLSPPEGLQVYKNCIGTDFAHACSTLYIGGRNESRQQASEFLALIYIFIVVFYGFFNCSIKLIGVNFRV